MKNKKGAELTTTQIVMLIVLIVSFVVILYFFFRLNLGATTNADICHNSVALKGRSSGIAGDLQCKTDYVCITNGGKCVNMVPTITTTVDSSNKNATMKAIADQMANCWWEFGEGKLDYLGLDIVQQAVHVNQACAICSLVGFSSIPSISYKDFIDYLANTKKDNSQTYLQYLYGFSNVQDLLSSSSSTVTAFYNSQTIDTGSQYAIVTGEGKSGFAFWKTSGYLDPVIVKSSDISSLLGNQCGGNFITQAS